jgi:hypothetical protein
MDTDPLAELRDLHAPTAIGMWPPALGWWILAALVIAALAYIFYHRYQRRQQAKFWIGAQQELQSQMTTNDLEGQTALRACNEVLKRAAMHGFPAENLAHLSGAQWIDWLVRNGFDCPAEQVLIEQWYREDTEAHLVQAYQKSSLVWLQQQAKRWRRV